MNRSVVLARGAKSGLTHVSVWVTSYHLNVAFFLIAWLLQTSFFKSSDKVGCVCCCFFPVFLWEDEILDLSAPSFCSSVWYF